MYRKWGRVARAGRVLYRTCGEGGCAGRVLYRKWPGVVVVGRIMSCSGVVLVPVGGLWQCPGAAHGHRGQAVWTLRRSMHRRWWGCARKSSPCALETPKFDVFEVAGRILSRVEWGRGRAGRILSRLLALHRPRNSPWPDTTPAPPAPGGPATILCGASAPPHRRRWGVLHYTKPSCGVSPACRTPV